MLGSILKYGLYAYMALFVFQMYLVFYPPTCTAKTSLDRKACVMPYFKVKGKFDLHLWLASSKKEKPAQIMQRKDPFV